LVTKATLEERLTFSPPGRAAVSDAEVVITAVGTHDGNGGWQTDTMDTCLAEVVPHLRADAVLVVRSTLPPEYVRALEEKVAQMRADAGRPMIRVMLSPEFTREGQAIKD